jgi:FkbM family methyltransferase
MRIRLDIGAYTGGVSLPWMISQDVCVFAFEPGRVAFNELFKKALVSPRYCAINKAVSFQEGMRDFYVSQDAASSSLLPYTEEGLRSWVCEPGRIHGVKEVTKVETVSLERFLKEEGITHVELTKVDAQGHDLDVIRSAGDRIVDFDVVVFEVQVTTFELYRGGTKLDEAEAFMIEKGFELYNTKMGAYDQEINLFYKRTGVGDPPRDIGI